MNYIIIYMLLSFGISILLGNLLIPLIAKLRLGQHIRETAPEEHQKKSGVPTFGGIIFIFAALITICASKIIINNELKIIIYSFIIFAAVGFMDDALKVMRKKNEGLTALQKIILLIIAALYCSIYIYQNISTDTTIIVPFIMKSYNLGICYLPFSIFFLTAMPNAVNLTDGLDGLAASVSLLVITFFAIISFYFGKISIALFCSILAAALLGFLRFNSYPAKIIMGDTGALALGGCIATIAVILKLPLIIILVGGIYFFETVTTMIQIAVFRLTRKRVFKMTPIHHSYELSGWHEAKIVTVFSIATAILCIIGFLSLTSNVH